VSDTVISDVMREVRMPDRTASGSTSAAEFAERYGLDRSGARPSILSYLGQLWTRRHFIRAFATAKTLSLYTTARLGQVWQVLTPLLNVAVYYLIFGVLFNTRRGTPNFIAFLVIGVFVFTYTQRAVLVGSKAISDNLGLIRALHFPRASLPLALTLVELQQLGISMGVLAVIVLATGESVTLNWLLVVPALALQTLFNVGFSLAVARFGARVTDVSQLLPFLFRTWLYLSGVFYEIKKFTTNAPDWVAFLMKVNPAAVYIEVVRDALLATHTAVPHAWLLATAWALLACVVGFVYFWQAEEKYGRG